MVCQSFYRQYIPRFLVTAAQAGPRSKRGLLFTVDKLMSGSSLEDKEATKLRTQTKASTSGQFAAQNPHL